MLRVPGSVFEAVNWILRVAAGAIVSVVDAVVETILLNESLVVADEELVMGVEKVVVGEGDCITDWLLLEVFVLLILDVRDVDGDLLMVFDGEVVAEKKYHVLVALSVLRVG